jgi:hypothetical protein
MTAQTGGPQEKGSAWAGCTGEAIAGNNPSDAMASTGTERIAGEASTTGVPAIRQIVQWSASCDVGTGLSACQSLQKWPCPPSVFGGHDTEHVSPPCGSEAAPHSSSHSAYEHDALCKAGHTTTPSTKSTNKTLFNNRFMFD